jgi:hypothetical protein
VSALPDPVGAPSLDTSRRTCANPHALLNDARRHSLEAASTTSAPLSASIAAAMAASGMCHSGLRSTWADRTFAK